MCLVPPGQKTAKLQRSLEQRTACGHRKEVPRQRNLQGTACGIQNESCWSEGVGPCTGDGRESAWSPSSMSPIPKTRAAQVAPVGQAVDGSSPAGCWRRYVPPPSPSLSPTPPPARGRRRPFRASRGGGRTRARSTSCSIARLARGCIKPSRRRLDDGSSRKCWRSSPTSRRCGLGTLAAGMVSGWDGLPAGTTGAPVWATGRTSCRGSTKRKPGHHKDLQSISRHKSARTQGALTSRKKAATSLFGTITGGNGAMVCQLASTRLNDRCRTKPDGHLVNSKEPLPSWRV